MEHKEFAINLAKEAGKIIRKNFSPHMKIEWKSDNSPLTITDKKINSLVIKKVKENFPQHSIIGEEGSFKVKNSEFSWVCDPIDGTFPFTHGIPISTFSLALVNSLGQPVLGVIYEPYTDRLFYAEKGKGTFLNNKKIKIPESKSLKNTMSGMDLWNIKDKPYLMEIYKEFNKREMANFELLSICYQSICMIMGHLSVAIYPATKPWDVAAVKIIVEEAGGIVTDLDGEDQRYDQNTNGAIITSKTHFSEILEIVKKAKA